MKKLLLLFLAGTTYTQASAQALPPDALVKCTTTKDVKAFITTVKSVWLTPYGHKDWAPSPSVRKAYNNATRESAPCEAIAGYDKATDGRFLAVKNFEDKMVQIDLSHIDLADVEAMRKYVSENGFTKGYTTSWETWKSDQVVVEIPNPGDDPKYLKMCLYTNIKK